ncbi:MAG: hypothetical protein ACJ796_05130 [Gemmatimonadaceae bacterium]
MMTRRHLRCAWPILTVALTACVLPLNVTESGSPALVGVIHRDDGTPAVGTRVAITNDQGHTSCAHTTARTFTDSAGVFRFPPTTLVQRWVLIIPPVERFVNWYGVCAGPADSALELAYHGIVSLQYGGERATVDSVNCLRWTWRGRARATCTGPRAVDRLQRGGGWSDANGSGYYRLIAAGLGSENGESGLYVQWVQQSATGSPEVVRETVAIPLAPNSLSILEAKLFAENSGAVCVDVRALRRPPHWYSVVDEVHEAIELRGPGDSRSVVSCP